VQVAGELKDVVTEETWNLFMPHFSLMLGKAFDSKSLWREARKLKQGEEEQSWLSVEDFESFIMELLGDLEELKDSQLTILKAPFLYPTGYFMQEVESLTKYSITNVHKVKV